jgi:hypothetical protein
LLANDAAKEMARGRGGDTRNLRIRGPCHEECGLGIADGAWRLHAGGSLIAHEIASTPLAAVALGDSV